MILKISLTKIICKNFKETNYKNPLFIVDKNMKKKRF